MLPPGLRPQAFKPNPLATEPPLGSQDSNLCTISNSLSFRLLVIYITTQSKSGSTYFHGQRPSNTEHTGLWEPISTLPSYWKIWWKKTFRAPAVRWLKFHSVNPRHVTESVSLFPHSQTNLSDSPYPSEGWHDYYMKRAGWWAHVTVHKDLGSPPVEGSFMSGEADVSLSVLLKLPPQFLSIQ